MTPQNERKPLKGPKPMGTTTVNPAQRPDFTTWCRALKVSSALPTQRHSPRK